MIIDELFEAPQRCPECGGISFSDLILAEKKDACYYKVKSSAKVWPSAYASGRLVQCRKKGAGNYGNKSEGVMEMDKSQTPPGRDGSTDSDAGKKEYTAKIITPKKAVKDGAKILNKVLNKKKGVAENTAQPLSVQQLATISDEALDNAYGYGRSTPGNTFGWQANLKSAAFAKQMIDQGVTDIEAISDAIHKGWNTTAQAFVQNPKQFDDTAKLAAAGKLEAKLQQRAQLMKQNYAQLPEEEKEKDRVVARALLQAMRGSQQPGIAEGKADYNFDIEDLKRLERIRDLATLKAQALVLISKPSAKPMKPEKVEWFKNALERMNSPMKVIKLMYDLLLSGEGNAVVGTRSSMNPNSYRQRFGEQGMAEGDLNELSTEKLAQYKTAAGADAKKADASGDYARGDKRFKGINRATNKQFDNDLKKHGQQSVAEDADCQDMVTRIKQLAGMSPLKTVHGSEQRRYRDMPTAVQPPNK